jgi:hypothetical protein
LLKAYKMASSAAHTLQHFYFGQLVHNNKPAGDGRVLAASPGVGELSTLAVERFRPVAPPAGSSSWALVRGRSRDLPFLLVQTAQDDSGAYTAHYILVAADTLKSIGGNLDALLPLLEDTLPTFKQLGEKLEPLTLHQPASLSIAAQVDQVLDLMMVTNNKTKILEALLTTIVQGKRLLVTHAPTSLEERLLFIKGLLVLLPPSARYGVTFNTHNPTAEGDAQIVFTESAQSGSNTIYDWERQDITTDLTADSYSRFVISQLRLDAERVIQYNSSMTEIAGWRLSQGERLADALAYAAKRMRLDEALRHHQPVDKDEVADVLMNDPTLDGDLQHVYAQYLISVSLAMQDMSHAAPVAMLLRANTNLAETVRRQMMDALNDGRSDLVFETLINWMSNALGPEGRSWVDLTHRAALLRLKSLIEQRDLEGINQFLVELQGIGPAVAIGEVIPRVMEMTLPFSVQDAAIAENLFLLAVRHLSDKTFRKLMDTRTFQEQLSPSVKHLWGYISARGGGRPPEGLLIQTARSFGPEWEPVVLLRMMEFAESGGRTDLIDGAALNALVDIARSQQIHAYRDRLVRIINVVEEKHIGNLDDNGVLYLHQIRLLMEDYAGLARGMLSQSATLYRGDRQDEYLELVERIFSEVPLAPYVVPRALEGIEARGIRSVPLIMAAAAALRHQPGSEDVDLAAQRAVEGLHEGRHVLEVLPPRVLLLLLDYYMRREDVSGAIQVSQFVPAVAAYQGEGGINVLAETYRRLNWDQQTRRAGLQMLREYVREAEDGDSQQAVVYFGKELGEGVQRKLEVTYLMKKFMDDMHVVSYVNAVRMAALLLKAVTVIYADSRRVPSSGVLFNTLEGLKGSLSTEERREAGRTALRLGQVITQLERQYRSSRPRNETLYVERLLTAEVDPRSAVDVFRVMSGYLARGRRFSTEILPESAPLLDGYDVRSFAEALTVAERVLANASRTATFDRAFKLTAAEVRDEIESLWRLVDNDQRQELGRNLAITLQILADLVVQIGENGDTRAFEDSGLARRIDSGRHKPRSALEFLRFVYGYYTKR